MGLGDLCDDLESIEMIRDLIESGVDLNTPDSWGYPPIFCLMNKLICHTPEGLKSMYEREHPTESFDVQNIIDIISLLIAKGASLNPCKLGDQIHTPLTYACKYSLGAIAQLLLDSKREIHVDFISPKFEGTRGITGQIEGSYEPTNAAGFAALAVMGQTFSGNYQLGAWICHRQVIHPMFEMRTVLEQLSKLTAVIPEPVLRMEYC